MNKWIPIRVAAIIALAALVIAAVTGCAGSSGIGSNGSGQLAVHMSDGGGPGITAVSVTITKIEANIDGSWQTVSNATQTVNLLDLVTNDTVLASATLPAGSYTQIRLIVSSGTVTDASGTHNLVIPSGLHTGIKVNVNFTITANELIAVLLDFNVAQSIVLQGNGTYLLKPVIPAVIQVLSGTATGVVSDASGPVAGASVTATYESGPSFAPGTIVNTTTTIAGGIFKVWALLPGTYTFTFSFRTASNVVETATVNNVVITANQNTDLGAVLLM